MQAKAITLVSNANSPLCKWHPNTSAHDIILGGTFGRRSSGSSLGLGSVCSSSLKWQLHIQTYCAQSQTSLQSKHGPLTVCGSLAMFNPPREPARLDLENLGQLRDRLKARLAASLFPLPHELAASLWVKRCADCGLAHLPGLAGGAESVG